jgi:hypothetical protein
MAQKQEMDMNASVETFAAEYDPYHTMAAFRAGVEDYRAGVIGWNQPTTDTAAAQAYDRGVECAIRVSPHSNVWELP